MRSKITKLVRDREINHRVDDAIGERQKLPHRESQFLWAKILVGASAALCGATVAHFFLAERMDKACSGGRLIARCDGMTGILVAETLNSPRVEVRCAAAGNLGELEAWR